jgi:hypothetical protein
MKGIPAVSVKTKWVVLLCFIYRHHDKSQRPKGEEKNRVDGMLSLGDNKLVEIFMITETKVQHAILVVFAAHFGVAAGVFIRGSRLVGI